MGSRTPLPLSKMECRPLLPQSHHLNFVEVRCLVVKKLVVLIESYRQTDSFLGHRLRRYSVLRHQGLR